MCMGLMWQEAGSSSLPSHLPSRLSLPFPLPSLTTPLPLLSFTHPTQFTATEPVSKVEAALFSLLQRPHIKALIESHDMVKDRKYLPQVPIMDTPFYPTNTTKTTEGLQQRTVGLYKEPDQPLVRVEGGDGVGWREVMG